MKKQKREYKKYYICPATGEPDEWTLGNINARWKRKNRIRQLKHTIKVLTRALRDTEECLNSLNFKQNSSLYIPTIGNPDLNKSEKNSTNHDQQRTTRRAQAVPR